MHAAIAHVSLSPSGARSFTVLYPTVLCNYRLAACITSLCCDIRMCVFITELKIEQFSGFYVSVLLSCSLYLILCALVTSTKILYCNYSR